MTNINLIFGTKYQMKKSVDLHQEPECVALREQKNNQETCPSCCCEYQNNVSPEQNQAKG